LKHGDNIELSIIDHYLNEMRNHTNIATTDIAKYKFFKITGFDFMQVGYDGRHDIDLLPLRELIIESGKNTERALRGYRYLIAQTDMELLSIGRRGQDLIREMTLSEMENAFLLGSPTDALSSNLISRILKKSPLGLTSRLDAMKFIQENTGEILKKIPVFHESGEAKFLLHIYPYEGKYRAYNVENYSELVGLTTVQEADIAANLTQAAEIGTRLLKFNDTGHSADYYLERNDERCAAINNRIVSLEQGGTTIRGQYFPYYKDLLPGRYNTPHPYCRHHLTPYPEELIEAVA